MTEIRIEGFSDESKREIAEGVRLDRTQPLQEEGESYLDYPDRRNMYRGRVTTEITAAQISGTVVTPGQGICDIYRRNTGNNTLEKVGQNYPVYNDSTQKFAVGTNVEISQDGIGDYWCNGHGKVETTMRFVSEANMHNREIDVVVDFVQGPGVTNPETGEDYKPGDRLKIADPTNLFPEAQREAEGWAFFREDYDRWEIRDIVLPVDELTGSLKYCLRGCDLVAYVTIYNPEYNQGVHVAAGGSRCALPGGPRQHVKMSSYNATALPREIQFNGEPTVELVVRNFRHLDGMPGSEVRIKRSTDAWFHEPFNTQVPRAGSASTYLWRLEHVERRMARWVWGTWRDTNPEIEGFCDGDDPRTCGFVEFRTHDELPCPLDGQFFQAHYNPEEDYYFLVNTVSAWMGEPEDLANVLAGSSGSDSDGLRFEGCDLKYQYQIQKGWACGNKPIEKETDIELTPFTVLTGVSIGNNSWTFTTGTVYVCAAEVGSPIVIAGTDCDDYYGS